MAGPGNDGWQELANTSDVGNVVQNVQTTTFLRQDNLASTSIEGDRNQFFRGCTFNVAFQQTGQTNSSGEERKMRKTETQERAENKTQLVKELQNKYRIWCGETQSIPFIHDKYDLDKLFVTTGIKYLEEKHGDQEKWTILKDYKTVFTDPKVKSKRRIIDGEPGYGKSTLALQIVKDWCDGVAPLNQYDIVILLRLRQFKNVPSVYSAIKRFLLPKDSSLTEDDVKDLLDSSSTLVVLDGYDEYPDREKEDTDVNHIIKGDMFQEHEVVVTTRTSCLPPNHTNTTIKRLRLTGFDDDSRETYVRNVVSRGSSDVADTIMTFLKVNPVPADLSKIPLFLAMISFMVKISEKFPNLTTVTDFFRNIIKCFHSHKQIKTTGGTGGKGQDHSKLDKVAFEGLSGDVQQISWDKENLVDKIGKNLYDEYVSIGILIEEESFDYDTLGYNTETRFFHKLFAEWYAANHFAKVASQPDAAVNTSNMQSLKNLNPDDVHYMYRYTCGLNPEAALKIIKHLAKNGDYAKSTLLCRTEWGGGFEAIQDTARLLCSQIIRINISDSLLLQQSTIALIEFASRRKIPLNKMYLFGCLSIGSTGNLRVKPSNLSLPVIDTSISNLGIFEFSRVITVEETESILQYAAKCRWLKKLWFWRCLLPQYVKKTDSVSVLRSREVTVDWYSPGPRWYRLILSSGRWEHYHTRSPMTDEQYQETIHRSGDQVAQTRYTKFDSGPSRQDLSEVSTSASLAGTSGSLIPEGLGALKRHGKELSHSIGDAPVPREQSKVDSTNEDTRTTKHIQEIECKGSFQQPFPETLQLITKNSATVRIPGTNVVLKVPPDALPEDMDECEIKMRILPRKVFKDPALTFSSNASVVVEILPNNLSLKHPGQLLIPHCLCFKEGKTPTAKIYISHHEEGSTASWVEHSDLQYRLEDTYCAVWLHRFCWIAIKIDDEEVFAKRLILFTWAQILTPWDQHANLIVGCYPQLDGEGTFLKLNTRTRASMQVPFTFMKEGSHPLCLLLKKFPRQEWELSFPKEEMAEIAFKDISVSGESQQPFVLEKKKKNVNTESPRCVIIASQHQGLGPASLPICPELSHPLSSHPAVGHGSPGNHCQLPQNPKVVTSETIQFLSNEITKEWQDVGRSLKIHDAKLEQIKQENSTIKNAIYEMLLHWTQRNGSKATYEILEKSLEKAGRKDLAEIVQKQEADEATTTERLNSN